MARTKPTAEGEIMEIETEAQTQPEVTETEAQDQNGEAAPNEQAEPEASTEKADKPDKPEKPEEQEIDLADFEASLEVAVSSMDIATGEPTKEAVTAVQAEYRKLNGNKAKSQARIKIRDGLKEAVKDGLLERAKCLMTLDEEIKTAPAKREPSEKKVVDPTEAYVEARAALGIAYNLVAKPEGLAEDAEAKVIDMTQQLHAEAQRYIEYLNTEKDKRGDEPEVSQVAKNAAKLAIGKKTKGSTSTATRGTGYDGPKRSVKAHIASAFAGVSSGTFLKVSEIVKHTSEEYGNEHPSPGAVTASLKSAKFDVEGVTAESPDGHLGARKA